MKRKFICFAAILIFCGCSSDSYNESNENSVLKIQFSYDKFASVESKLNAIFENGETNLPTTRASDISSIDPLEEQQMTEEIMQALQPLVADGAAIRDAILNNTGNEFPDMTETERTQIQNLNDAGLAGLAYMAAALSTIQEDTPIDQRNGSERDHPILYRDCISKAIGLDVLSGTYNYITGTAGLTTATTMRTLAKAFFKRTWGWVSVAWALYDYGQCVKEKKYDCTYVVPISDLERAAEKEEISCIIFPMETP